MDATHPSRAKILRVVSHAEDDPIVASLITEHLVTCVPCNMLALSMIRVYASLCEGAARFSALLGTCVRPQDLIIAQHN